MSATLVELLVTDDGVTLIGLGATGEPWAEQVRLDVASLRAAARSMLGEGVIAHVAREETWRHDGMRLLVDALTAHTEPGTHIVLIPHGPLHHLPLHIMHGGNGPLLARNPVSYAPSVGVLERCRGERTPAELRALVAADSGGDLGGARVEGYAVAGLFGVTPLIEWRADRERLLGELMGPGRPNVLHLACHGVFVAEDPDASRIELAGVGEDASAAVRRASDLTAAEVTRLALPLELVTLSACRSGTMELRAGDEPFGLVRAFLLAGAASVVAAAWPVNDLSTGLLMHAFYRELLAGTGKAEALRRAQLAVRDMTAAGLLAACDEQLDGPLGDRPDALRLVELRKAEALSVLNRREEARALLVRDAALRDLRGTAPHDDLLARRVDAARRAIERPAADVGERPFANPLFWGGFSLFGDWE